MARIRRLARKVIPTRIDGIFFRQMTQRSISEITTMADGETADDVNLRVYRCIVCDEKGDPFDDITDAESLREVPLEILLGVPDELTRVFTPDPKP